MKVKVRELLSPIEGKLTFVPGMMKSQDLAPLNKLANCGKISVNVYGFSDSASGEIFHFYPVGAPEVKRCALKKFFDEETIKQVSTLLELLSL